ncbi:baseplate J/gp47 family protein [Clostridiaceae bacterium M8S5]|nr:baseplate J/gp47 family protein [Clostridiaceae bacterium M8S5]
MQNYKNKTFKNLMSKALKHIPDDIDKREGSIIYDTLSAVLVEITQEYIELDNILELGFVQTSNGEWLTKKCAELGVNRRLASKSHRKGVFNKEIPIGARFSIEDTIYTVVAPIEVSGDEKEYKLVAEKAGVKGNKPFGKLLAISYIEGLEKAELEDVLVAGEEEESDESLLARYLAYANKPSFGGNKQQYISFVEEMDGVGEVKCYPLHNGRGTVKLVAITPDKQPLSDEKISEIQNKIDPKKDGMGDGYAPIGHIVTVNTANETGIDVAVDVDLKEDVQIDTVKEEIKSEIKQYFKENSFNMATIRVNTIGGIIIKHDDVLDYRNLTLNGGTSNITVNEDSIIVLKSLNVY